jgi:hypothetical protein
MYNILYDQDLKGFVKTQEQAGTHQVLLESFDTEGDRDAINLTKPRKIALEEYGRWSLNRHTIYLETDKKNNVHLYSMAEGHVVVESAGSLKTS